MKSVYTIFGIFFVLISVGLGCEPEQASKLIIYGSNTCDHCINLKKALDSANTQYQFYDIDVDEAKEKEMVGKLQKFKIRGNISLPVVDVYGKELLIGTNYEELTSSIKKQE